MTHTYQRYPAMRYHKTLAPEGREVTNAQKAAELGEGWVRSPAAFDPGYVELPEPEDGTPMDDVAPIEREYIPYPAMRYSRDGQERIVQTKEQDNDLDPAIWKATPDPAAWANEPAPATPPPPAPPATGPAQSAIAASLYLLNAGESAALVNGQDTPEKLDVLEAAERAHPKHDGGRVSVLKAIAARREALAVKASA